MADEHRGSEGNSTAKAPKVFVIILTWNRVEDILMCVESVRHLSYPNYEIVVVDNNSEDDTVPALREKFPALELIVNDKNLGYSGGNNVGMRYALSQGAEYVLLLNNDLKVAEDMLDHLVRVASSDGTIGAVGAKVLKMEDPTRTWAVYGHVNYGPWFVSVAGRDKPDRAEYNVQKDVEFVIGCGILFSRKVLQEVGLLDEFLFGYHEDVEWCMRARDLGYRIVYAPESVVYHKGSSSVDESYDHFMPSTYFLGRNGVLLAKRYAGWWQWLKFLTLFVVAFAGRCTLRVLVDRSALKQERRLLKGFIDGFKGIQAPLKELNLQ